QAVLYGQSLHRLSVHVRGKKLKVVPSTVFGAIHSSIGMPDQGFAVRTVFWEDADTETATNAKGVTLDDESGRHCIHKPLGRNGGAGDVVNMGEHDEEFIPP